MPEWKELVSDGGQVHTDPLVAQVRVKRFGNEGRDVQAP